MPTPPTPGPATCPLVRRGLTLRSACETCTGVPAQGQLTLARGDILAKPGDTADHVFAVCDGWIRESVPTRNGDFTTTRFVGPGDLVGTDAIAFGKHKTRLDALQPSRVCSVLVRNVALALSERPRLGFAMAAVLSEDLAALRKRIARSTMSAHDRVECIVLEFLQTTTPGSWTALPASREELAEALGLTIETVSRQIQQLQREGVIEVHGRHVRRVLGEHGEVTPTPCDHEGPGACS